MYSPPGVLRIALYMSEPSSVNNPAPTLSPAAATSVASARSGAISSCDPISCTALYIVVPTATPAPPIAIVEGDLSQPRSAGAFHAVGDPFTASAANSPPSAGVQVLDTPKADDVQNWIDQAPSLAVDDVRLKRGIAALERLCVCHVHDL